MYIASFVLTISCLVNVAGAREPSDVSIDVTQAPGESKQEAFDKATEEATRKAAEDLVGADKLGPAWAQIKSRLLKNSARYVLFIRGSAAVDTPAGPKTTVQLRLAPDALEGLLREFGLYDGASVRVLPLISAAAPVGPRYAWWAESSFNGVSPATDYFRRVVGQLNGAVRGKSIYLMDPLNPSLRAGIPNGYRVEGLRHDDQLLLARYLKADAVMTGRVDVAKSTAGPAQLIVALELWQARGGRVIAEAARAEPLAGESPKIVNAAIDQATKRAFADLTAKLIEAAAGGALNLNTVRLGVAGALSYRQQSDFKRLLGELREVRNLRERLFEPGRVTYEVDTPLGPPELARALARAPLKGFAVTPGETSADAVVLNVRPVSPGG